MKKITFFVLCFLMIKANSQNSNLIEKSNLTPYGYFDKVYDMFGKAYSIDEIAIDDNTRFIANAKKNKSLSSQNKSIKAKSCIGSYYNLYFEDGWFNGIDQSKAPLAEFIFCQVLQDLSDFMPSPLTTSGNKVNLWVRNFSNINSQNNVLGIASPYYITPSAVKANYSGGLIDNAIWKTIHSGQDAYSDFTGTLSSTSQQKSSTFFHGIIGFNFLVNWNYNLTNAPSNNEYDLYTIFLHEISHALGFSSLIGKNQMSIIGNNHFNRYDKFLQNINSIPLLTQTGSVGMYGYNYNNAAFTLNPAGCPSSSNQHTDYTNCTNAVQYSSSFSQVVYSPLCFEDGSSLSHFEDMCLSNGISCTNGCNNNYFTMSEATNMGVMKRYLQSKERQVLCDIGYAVNSIFGDATNLNYKDYNSSTCSGISVVGINDGVLNSNYIYNGFVGSAITIQDGSSTNNNNFLFNDINADGFEGLEIVYGDGQLSTSSGTKNSVVTYMPSSSTSRVHLLRYVPIQGAEKGNITYIFIWVKSISCLNTNACFNLIPNSDFENSTGCFWFDRPKHTNASVECWDAHINSPDIIKRGCPQDPDGIFFCNLGTETWHNDPPVNSYNFTDPTIVNNSTLGLHSQNNTNHYASYTESVQTTLKQPLIKGESYSLSFWARVNNNSIFGNIDKSFIYTPALLTFCTNENPLLSPSIGIEVYPDLLYSGHLKKIPNGTITVPNDNKWHKFSFTFIENNDDQSQLFLGIDRLGLNPYTNSKLQYVYVDDIELRTSSSTVSFSIPEEMSLCEEINLIPSPNIQSGYFTANGIVLNPNSSGQIVFKPTQLGIYTIVYNYVNSNGCQEKIMNITEVKPFVGAVITGNNKLCINTTSQLNCNLSGGVWSSSNSSAQVTQSGAVYGQSVGSATISYSFTNSFGCSTKLDYDITIDPVITVGSITTQSQSNEICVSDIMQLFCNPNGGVWSVNNNNISIAQDGTLQGQTQGTSTVKYSFSNSCGTSSSEKVIIVKHTPPIPLILSNHIKYCIGKNNPPTLLSLIDPTSLESGSTLIWYDYNTGNVVQPIYDITTVGTYYFKVSQYNSISNCSANNDELIVVEVVNDCKVGCSDVRPQTIINYSTTPISNTNYTGFCWIKGDVSFDGTTNFTNAEVIVEEGVTITFLNGSNTNIQSSHFYTCSGMWKGFVVQPTAQLNIIGTYTGGEQPSNTSTLIEDAEIAIDYQTDLGTPEINFSNAYLLNIENAIFNRNGIGVQIKNLRNTTSHLLSTLPFYIKNTIFTSRQIPFSSGYLAWPNIQDVITTQISKATAYPNTPQTYNNPFIDDYSVVNGNAVITTKYADDIAEAFLKDGTGSNKPSAAIKLANVGMRDYDNLIDAKIVIGGEGSNANRNSIIIDNHIIGIDATESNLSVNNCVFQKPIYQNYYYDAGIGIRAFCIGNNSALEVNTPSNFPNNTFYNMKAAIVSGGDKINITNTDIVSNQDITNLTTNGNLGIAVGSSGLSELNITNNNITNIRNGIWFFGSFGIMPSFINNVNISNNIISNTLSSTPPYQSNIEANAFIENAITLETVNSIWKNDIPLYCNANILKNAFNGIRLSNWRGKTAIINDNTINLATDNFLSQYSEHYGIALEGGINSDEAGLNTIQNNTVTGSSNIGDYDAQNQTAILLRNQVNTNLGCNTVNNTKHGFRFFKNNLGTHWWDNTMYPTNQNGMTLDEEGYIGVQGIPAGRKGSLGCTSNNIWEGDVNEWLNNGNNKTYCQNNSSPLKSPLIVNPSNLLMNPDGSNVNSCNPFKPDGFYQWNSNPLLKSIYYGFNGPCEHCNGSGGTEFPDFPIDKELEQIADGTLVIQNDDADKRLYAMQQELFEVIKQDPQIASTPTLQTFMSNNAWSSLDFIHYTEKYLALGDLNTVDLLLTYWPNSNKELDNNYYQYYEWITNMKSVAGWQPPLSNVYDLASKCPQKAGNIVYAARNLYNILTKKINVFENTCGGAAFRQKPNTKNNSIVKKEPIPFKLFPNPATNLVNISWYGINKIEVFDMLGKKVLQNNYSEVFNTNLDISKLTKGIYFVKVQNTKAELKTQKLIVQ